MFAVVVCIIQSHFKYIVKQLGWKLCQNDLETYRDAPWIYDKAELRNSAQHWAICSLSHIRVRLNFKLSDEFRQKLHAKVRVETADSNKKDKRDDSDLLDSFRKVENTSSHSAGQEGKNGGSEGTFSDGAKGSVQEGPLFRGFNWVVGKDRSWRLLLSGICRHCLMNNCSTIVVKVGW